MRWFKNRDIKNALNRLGTASLVVLVGLVAIQAVSSAFGWLGERIDRAVGDPWFEYYSVEYVATDTDVLWFASDAEWNRDLDRVEWHDVLRCDRDGDGDYEFYSSHYSSAANREARPRSTLEWAYSSAYPSRSMECVLHSTISGLDGELKFSQSLYSEPFTVSPAPIEEDSSVDRDDDHQT